MKRQSKPATRIRVRLILGAIFVAAFITACPNPDQLMDARINDFLRDVAQLDGTGGANLDRADSIVTDHLHPQMESRDQARSPQFWDDSFLNAFGTTSYSWSVTSVDDVPTFSQSVRRSGTVVRSGGGGSTPARFFMKQSGADWLIRAIDDGGDGNLLQNIR